MMRCNIILTIVVRCTIWITGEARSRFFNGSGVRVTGAPTIKDNDMTHTNEFADIQKYGTEQFESAAAATTQLHQDAPGNRH